MDLFLPLRKRARDGLGEKVGIRNEGGGFAANIYVAMPEGLRWRVSLVSSAFPSRGRCPEGADRAQAV